MIHLNLENFKIKVFNTLRRKDELKYLDYEIDLSENHTRFYLSNGICLGFDQKVFVYYADEGMLNNPASEKKQYLNRESTLREFNIVEDAFDYIEYLQNLMNSKQMEQFFYFEYKSKKANQLWCQKFSLKIVNNKSVDDYIARIDTSGLDFTITICFFNAYQFQVNFTPNNENWSSHKTKKYGHIDSLFLDLELFTSYESIAIEESEREFF
ncbi:hypothetical protein ACFFLS_03540 [Flavobacterium procerum]|uniref:Uncharacterized protein n=1 Tax=Flavobacterium procerum TaxID=1455569 RepID=A0ABV6BKX5_9FLAO